MADKKISPDEFSKIAQLGVKAKGSLQAGGGPELQGLSGSIDKLTSQLARGEWPAAGGSLDGFGRSLPTRPGRPWKLIAPPIPTKFEATQLGRLAFSML